MELLVLSKEESIKDSLIKLVEETIEVCNEVNDENKENTTSEVLDVIQVCIGMLDKLEQEGINLRKAIEKHNMKLLSRGWRYKGVIHLTRV